jgi:hypothetical protein
MAKSKKIREIQISITKFSVVLEILDFSVYIKKVGKILIPEYSNFIFSSLEILKNFSLDYVSAIQNLLKFHYN